MGKALYRAYRSQSLDEVIGQEHITKTLQRALKSGQIAHAYLFTGPRGVGKTSVARILAHAVNNLPYSAEQQHIDIIEIDAASNNGVEDVRDLREKVHIAPTSSKYKVYIIDEVHMLSRAAFNALLKTLEEPPAHVIFILATTEVHKLPETIISRTQQYTFKTVPVDQVVDHLRQIAQAEKIKISDEALELIADYGSGSFRDSIGLLDQVRSSDNGEISADGVATLLGRTSSDTVSLIIEAVAQSDLASVMQQIEQARSRGASTAQLAAQLLAHLRQQLLNGQLSLDLPISLKLIEGLSAVMGATDPDIALEIRLLEAASVGSDITTSQPDKVKKPVQPKPKAEPRPKPAVTIEEPVPASQPIEAPTKPETLAEPAPTKQPVASKQPAANTDQSLDQSVWPQILDQIKGRYNTLYGILRMAKPVFEPGVLRLNFMHAFHQKRVNEAKNKGYIVEAITKVTGQKLTIECVVGEAQSSPKTLDERLVDEVAPAEADTDNPSLASISNIFGGGEVLDS